MKKLSLLLIFSMVFINTACGGLDSIGSATDGSCTMTINGTSWSAAESGVILSSLGNGVVSDSKGILVFTARKGKEAFVVSISQGFKGVGTFTNFGAGALLNSTINYMSYIPDESDPNLIKYAKSGKFVITKYTDPKSLINPGSIEGTFECEVVGIDGKVVSIKNGSFKASVIGF